MEYRYLGQTGLRVSNLCLGTMTFGHNAGRPGQADLETSHKMLDRFVAKGGNFIDTADVYQYGESERIVGSWINKIGSEKRKKLIIATKLFAKMDPSDPNSGGASRHHIVQSVENSLARLQTDYIDLLYIHNYDYGTPVEDVLRTLTDVVRSGKVHYIGASNFTGWQLQKAADASKYLNLEKFCCAQLQYNLLCRDVEVDSMEVCKWENISLLPWSPLKGGYLAGKLDRKSTGAPEGTRIHATKNPVQSHPTFEQFDNERTWAIIDTCKAIADKRGNGTTVAQVAIRWLLQRSTVSSVVLGAKTMEQLDDNLRSAELNLDEDEMAALDKASVQPIPVVHEQVIRMNASRLVKAEPFKK